MCDASVRNNSAVPRESNWPLFGIALFSIISRFLARSPLLKGPGYGWDDWSILVGFGLLVAANGLLDRMTRVGLGKDMWTLKTQAITTVLYLFFTLEFVYIGILAITKISVLLLYLRIFPSTVSTWFRACCYIVTGLCTAYAIAMWISILFECHPINYAWLLWDGEHKGTCINTQALIYACSAINIVLDSMVFFLPIPKLMQLEVSGRKKIGICLTFLVGLFVTICSAVRLQYLVQWGASRNPTWDYTQIAIWSAIEGNLSVICACLPAMAGPIKRAWQRTLGSRLSSRNSQKPGDSMVFVRLERDLELQTHQVASKEADAKPLAVSAIYGSEASLQEPEEETPIKKIAYRPLSGYPHHHYISEWRVS